MLGLSKNTGQSCSVLCNGRPVDHPTGRPAQTNHDATDGRDTIVRNLLKWAKGASEAVNKIELFVSSLMLLTLVVGMSMDAVSRYFLRHSISWAVPLCSLLMVWLAFLTSSTAFRGDSHQSFGFIVERMPVSVQRALRLVQDVLIIAALAIVIKAGMRLQGMQRLQMLPGVGLSRRWLTIAAIAGSALMMLTAALDFATALISVLCVVHQEMRE